MNLTTERLELAPIQIKDIEEILDMYEEPVSFKYIAPLQNKSRDYFTTFLLKKVEVNQYEVGFWVARMKGTGEFVGTTNLNQLGNTGMTHVGVHLKEMHFKKGFGFELMEASLKYGVEERKLTHIHSVFEEENQATRRILERLDFTKKEMKYIGTKLVNIFVFENPECRK